MSLGSPKIVLTASSSEASEWRHSIWQQMLSATIPAKFGHKWINPTSLVNESWPDGRAKYVPNGLRMVETLLLREYPEEDVVVCYLENLEDCERESRSPWFQAPRISQGSPDSRRLRLPQDIRAGATSRPCAIRLGHTWLDHPATTH